MDLKSHLTVTFSEAGFLVAVLDVGTIFEAKFQRVQAQNIAT